LRNVKATFLSISDVAIDSIKGFGPTLSRWCAVSVQTWTSTPTTQLSPLNNSSAKHIFVKVFYPIDHHIVAIDFIKEYGPTLSRWYAVNVQTWTSTPPTRLSPLNNSSVKHISVMVFYPINQHRMAIASIKGFGPTLSRWCVLSVQR
jgi:hypothetical protein